MEATPYRTIRVERDESIITITFDRPERRNAVSPQMHHELQNAFADVAGDAGTRAVILTGAGDAFCAGGDATTFVAGGWAELGGGPWDQEHPKIPAHAARSLVLQILEIDQPIIAAVNGDAAGLGATLALFSDIVIAAEDARIGDRHVQMGLVGGDGGVVIWPLLVGMTRAKRYMLTGDYLTGAEAARIGLITEAVPREQVLPLARQWADRFRHLPPLALRWTKFSMNKILREFCNLCLDTSAILEGVTMNSNEVRSAARAFLSKEHGPVQGG